ncbi:MAG TPA: sugar transferase [Azospirillum sp.]|nr:sugar transferase [Azospirillum sp.]
MTTPFPIEGAIDMKSRTATLPERAYIAAQGKAPTDASRGRAGSVYSMGKRVLDAAGAVVLLVVLSPLLLAAAALVRLSGPGPVLFRQVRIGRHEVPFTMFKLRTMKVGCDNSAQRDLNIRELRGEDTRDGDGIFKIAGDPRITKGGALLRRYSIDELPQLINVVRGEMSLVGPRPSLPWEVELFTPEQRRRHDCLPGMTGLWQVSGRNRLSMTEMLALDVAYAEARSFSLDLSILLRTPRAVLSGKDTR